MWRQKLKCSLSNIFLQKKSKDLCLKSKHVGACHLMTAKNSVFIIYQGSSVSKKSTILNIPLNMLCDFWGLVFFFSLGSMGNSLIWGWGVGRGRGEATCLNKNLLKKFLLGQQRLQLSKFSSKAMSKRIKYKKKNQWSIWHNFDSGDIHSENSFSSLFLLFLQDWKRFTWSEIKEKTNPKRAIL